MTSLADLLFAREAADPGAPAVFAGAEVRTVGQLAGDARAIADALAAAGLRAGQPVAVMLPNGADTVAAMFGVWAAGGVYLPLNPRLTDRERDEIVQAVPPAVVLREGEAPTRAVAVRSLEPDVALVTFTSGTTGKPKAVKLTHHGVLELIDGVLAKLRRGGAKATADRSEGARPMPNLIPVSLSLWAGIYTVLFAFRTGAPVIVMDRFDTKEFARLVREHGLRSTVLPPAAMTMLADDDEVTDLSPLRYVRSITSPLSPLQARRFAGKFGVTILNGYGQTELGGEVIGWNAADAKAHGDAKLGAVGRPHDGVKVRVIDPDTGDELGVDQVGELWIKAPAMSAGYATGGDLSDRLSDDGFLRTGDLGRVDADGFVWIEGRVSDMINRGGLKVFPAEVAEVLRLSPAVTDAAVVGVADERLGEVPWAFVVLAEGEVLDVGALESLCREHLVPYKVPVRFVAVDELPRNEVGKLVPAELLAKVER